jgi:hypothetical protein
MDPLALMRVSEEREQRVGREREQREREEQEGSGAKRFHTNHHTSTASIRRFL